MPRKSRPYEIGLRERLRDASHAVSYVKAAAEDSQEGFLLALRDLAEVTKGMSKVAEAADKNRENLYRMLSEDGNPRLDSLWAVLEAMGLRLTVEPIIENVAASVPLEEEKFFQQN
jgi:probable addiction module antidote protein